MLGLRVATAARSPVRSARGLIIVARDQPELWQALKHEFGNGDEIRVILDRRLGERRRIERCDGFDRRTRDRRSMPRIEEDLRTRKYVLVRPHYRVPRD